MVFLFNLYLFHYPSNEKNRTRKNFLAQKLGVYSMSNVSYKYFTMINSGKIRFTESLKAYLVLLGGLYLFMVLTSFNTTDLRLEYSIIRKGEKIGKLLFTRRASGTEEHLQMRSEVKFSFLGQITAHAREDATFQNQILLRSSVFREINGRTKSDKKTERVGNQYRLLDDDDAKTLTSAGIQYNMLCVYFSEPLYRNSIYSDNYQRFLKVEKLAPHHYRIEMPNGDVNEYHYKNGICQRVEVNSFLYHSTIQLASL